MTLVNKDWLATPRFEAIGTAPPSFVTNNIQDITTAVGRENLKWSASSMFGGAWFYCLRFMNVYEPLSNLQLERRRCGYCACVYLKIEWIAPPYYLSLVQTVSAIYTFYLAMTLFPDLQTKAQEEIDRVVGNDRLPALADRDNMPYISALQSEVYRWRPVAPIGLS